MRSLDSAGSANPGLTDMIGVVAETAQRLASLASDLAAERATSASLRAELAASAADLENTVDLMRVVETEAEARTTEAETRRAELAVTQIQLARVIQSQGGPAASPASLALLENRLAAAEAAAARAVAALREAEAAAAAAAAEADLATAAAVARAERRGAFALLAAAREADTAVGAAEEAMALSEKRVGELEADVQIHAAMAAGAPLVNPGDPALVGPAVGAPDEGRQQAAVSHLRAQRHAQHPPEEQIQVQK